MLFTFKAAEAKRTKEISSRLHAGGNQQIPPPSTPPTLGTTSQHAGGTNRDDANEPLRKQPRSGTTSQQAGGPNPDEEKELSRKKRTFAVIRRRANIF